MVAIDIGKKKRRPRGRVSTSDTSLTTGDRDLKQSSAEYKEEHRASLIQQGQGEEKVSAISSDHRRKQDDKKKSSYPCKNGPLCKWKEKGLCKFDHSKIPPCRYGKNCKRLEEGSCAFSHQQVFGKRKRADDQDTADDSQKRQNTHQTSTNEFPFDRDVIRTTSDDDDKSESDNSGAGRRFSQQQQQLQQKRHQQQRAAAAAGHNKDGKRLNKYYGRNNDDDSSGANNETRRRRQKSSKPCNNGPLCRLNKKGLCVFDHSSTKASNRCRYGNKCKHLAQGNCIFLH